MKAKVIKKFKDKRKGVYRNVGDVIEISEERFKEIVKTGPFVEEYTETPLPAETPSTNDETQNGTEQKTVTDETPKTKKTSKKTAAE